MFYVFRCNFILKRTYCIIKNISFAKLNKEILDKKIIKKLIIKSRHIKNPKDKTANSAESYEATHNELPHLNLCCLQIQPFHFGT